MEENNKIIAKFLGWEILNDMTYSKITKGKWIELDKLKFHSDWNWLMEVVEKIENLTDKNNFVLYDINIYSDAVIIADQEDHEKVSITKSDGFTSKIEMVYKACIEFVKWYNQNSEKEH